MIIAFHKPYGVLSQFTRELEGQRTLADFGFPKQVYPVGRLDMDSEGLLLLSDEKQIVDRLLNPKNVHFRTYQVQVEGLISQESLIRLSQGGLMIQGHKCLPCKARALEADPFFPPRDPPVRFRKSIPTSWVELSLTEGKNRQVRKMTAAVGFPTLRLVRVAIGSFQLGEIAQGTWKVLESHEIQAIFQQK